MCPSSDEWIDEGMDGWNGMERLTKYSTSFVVGKSFC